MTQGNGFMAISCSVLSPKKFRDRVYNKKKLEFLKLTLVKSCIPPVDTLKQISNE